MRNFQHDVYLVTRFGPLSSRALLQHRLDHPTVVEEVVLRHPIQELHFKDEGGTGGDFRTHSGERVNLATSPCFIAPQACHPSTSIRGLPLLGKLRSAHAVDVHFVARERLLPISSGRFCHCLLRNPFGATSSPKSPSEMSSMSSMPLISGILSSD